MMIILSYLRIYLHLKSVLLFIEYIIRLEIGVLIFVYVMNGI